MLLNKFYDPYREDCGEREDQPLVQHGYRITAFHAEVEIGRAHV